MTAYSIRALLPHLQRYVIEAYCAVHHACNLLAMIGTHILQKHYQLVAKAFSEAASTVSALSLIHYLSPRTLMDDLLPNSTNFILGLNAKNSANL
jgi:hypothetical protein